MYAPSPNTRLNRYEIHSLLGVGGMGEVYLAEDTELERQVALKILLAEVATDEDRVRRFEQEACATSALNHPNILTVYDIGENDGAPIIVAELLEGEELREHLGAARCPCQRRLTTRGKSPPVCPPRTSAGWFIVICARRPTVPHRDAHRRHESSASDRDSELDGGVEEMKSHERSHERS